MDVAQNPEGPSALIPDSNKGGKDPRILTQYLVPLFVPRWERGNQRFTHPRTIPCFPPLSREAAEQLIVPQAFIVHYELKPEVHVDIPAMGAYSKDALFPPLSRDAAEQLIVFPPFIVHQEPKPETAVEIRTTGSLSGEQPIS